MPKDVKTRTYDSSRRKEQARTTRSAILGAARDLFVEIGYVAATIEAIAAKAGVSPETIYAVLKNKRSILAGVMDLTLAGDDEEVAVLERAWVGRLAQARDPAERIRILARNGTKILERISPLSEAIRTAAATDPDSAWVWERYEAQRYEGQKHLIGLVVAGGHLRKGSSLSSAADIVFAIGSPETFRALVVVRGWSTERFERWYAETLTRLLLS